MTQGTDAKILQSTHYCVYWRGGGSLAFFPVCTTKFAQFALQSICPSR
jgi:hypothetical protein